MSYTKYNSMMLHAAMKRGDLLVVTLFPLLVFMAVFIAGVQFNYLVSLILLFALPSLYLSFKNKEKVKKVTVFSLLVSIPMDIIWEIIGFGDKAWSVPQSVLPYRLFGFMPIENYLWMFLVTYTILIFYEHFCDKKFQRAINPRIRIMNYTLYILALVLIILFRIDLSLISIPYAYLWAGILFFVIPCTLFLFKYPVFITPFFQTSVFFFYIHLLFELIGLKLNHWVYQGEHYLGWISFMSLQFPIEEFFFVLLLGGFAACTYYEYFTDKKL